MCTVQVCVLDKQCNGPKAQWSYIIYTNNNNHEYGKYTPNISIVPDQGVAYQTLIDNGVRHEC